MIPEILVFSKTWDTLGKDDQALIGTFAKEAQQEQRKLWYAMEEKSRKADRGRRRRDHQDRGQAVPGGGGAGVGEIRRAARRPDQTHSRREVTARSFAGAGRSMDRAGSRRSWGDTE